MQRYSRKDTPNTQLGVEFFDAFTRAAVASSACRKSNSDILMMQSAQHWPAKNVPGSFDGARYRRVVCTDIVRSAENPWRASQARHLIGQTSVAK
jgi:hypothetical protein